MDEIKSGLLSCLISVIFKGEVNNFLRKSSQSATQDINQYLDIIGPCISFWTSHGLTGPKVNLEKEETVLLTGTREILLASSSHTIQIQI